MDPTGHSIIAAIFGAINLITAPVVATTMIEPVVQVVKETVTYIDNHPKVKAGIYAATGAGVSLLQQRMMEQLDDAYQEDIMQRESDFGKLLDLSKKLKEKQEAEQEKAQQPIITGTEEEEKKKEVLFPEDPMNFQPLGLLRKSYNNGEILKWEVPGTKYAILEWNLRDNKNATELNPHYHVMTTDMKNKHLDGRHFYPGDAVPDPWATIYFPEL